MYGCESWAIKQAEHWRIDAFELRCWRRLLRVPLTSRRSNQSILKEISPEHSLEGLMLKLKLILWPHDGKNLLIGNDPDSGKDWRWEEKGNDRGWDGWMASPTDGHEFEYALGVGEGQGSLACCSPWGHKELHMTEWMNWTEVKDLGIRLIPSRIYVSRITNCPWEIEMIRHPSVKMSGRNMPQESVGYCFAEFRRKTWTLSIYLVSHKHLCIIWF